jgi:hypothetical protein
MNPLVHHIDHPTNQMVEPIQPVRPRVSPVLHTPALIGSRAPALFFQAARVHVLLPSRQGLDRADRAHLLVAQPFFIFAQSFYYSVSYFATNELSHFTYVITLGDE